MKRSQLIRGVLCLALTVMVLSVQGQVYMLTVRLDFQPGTQVHYSKVGYITLGRTRPTPRCSSAPYKTSTRTSRAGRSIPMWICSRTIPERGAPS